MITLKTFKLFENHDDIDPYGEEDWPAPPLKWESDDPIITKIIDKLISLGMDFDIKQTINTLERTKKQEESYAIYMNEYLQNARFLGLYNARSETEAILLCAIKNNDEELIDYDLDMYFANKDFINSRKNDLVRQIEFLKREVARYDESFTINNI
jgi:hypothetical protein